MAKLNWAEANQRSRPSLSKVDEREWEKMDGASRWLAKHDPKLRRKNAARALKEKPR